MPPGRHSVSGRREQEVCAGYIFIPYIMRAMPCAAPATPVPPRIDSGLFTPRETGYNPAGCPPSTSRLERWDGAPGVVRRRCAVRAGEGQDTPWCGGGIAREARCRRHWRLMAETVRPRRPSTRCRERLHAHAYEYDVVRYAANRTPIF